MKIFWARIVPFALFLTMSLLLFGKAEAGQAGPIKAEIVDISAWQGSVQWRRVAGSGIRGAYLKLTEGYDYRDPLTTPGRLQAMRKNKLFYGFYHFLRPKKRDAAGEARFFISQASELGGWGRLVPAIDIEETKLGPKATGDYLARFMDVLRSEGGIQRVLLYSSPLWWQKSVSLTSDLKQQLPYARAWIAHWKKKRPSPLAGLEGYVLHQYTSRGSVPGIRGRVDRNRTPNMRKLMRR